MDRNLGNKKPSNPSNFDLKKYSYDQWRDDVVIWNSYASVTNEEKGWLLYSALNEDSSGARELVRPSIVNGIINLNNETAVAEILSILDKTFKKSDEGEIWKTYKEYKESKRNKCQSIDDYIKENEKRLNQMNKKGMDICDLVAAMNLLDGADLKINDRKLALSAVNLKDAHGKYEKMKQSLRKFFGDEYGCEDADMTAKEKTINYEKGSEINAAWSEEANAMWNNNKRSGYQQKMYYKEKPGNFKCYNCGLEGHIARNCTRGWNNWRKSDKHDRRYNKTYQADKIENEIYETEKVTESVSEAFNHALLDSGCTSTVCGTDWIDCYIDSLSDRLKRKVKSSEANNSFKFGAGGVMKSIKRLTIPCFIAGEETTLTTDVIEKDLPLLLSKADMKKRKMCLNLGNDTLYVNNKEVNLQTTSNGHYVLPLLKVGITPNVYLLESTEGNKKEKFKLMKKLHYQFGHPRSQRLKSLLKNAGITDEEYDQCIDEISEGCEICKKYQRTPSRPIVSLPLAKDFNDVVAMDLKEWKKGSIYILYMIDVSTRYTRAAIIKNKERNTIIDNIMKMWIGTGLGCPSKFLVDNGGEFDNRDFKDVCENLGIIIMSTAGYSPFSNGLCERNHAVVDLMLEKIIAGDSECKLENALAWAIHAKNCLEMSAGYSPYQLVFGRNPKLPSVLHDNPPALEGTTINSSFAEHLNNLFSARKAFVKAESSEKIRRALRYKVRKIGNIYNNGDRVYFKRDNEIEWRGPGVVIGHHSRVVTVQYGREIYKVHETKVLSLEYELCDKSTSENSNKSENIEDGESQDDNEEITEDYMMLAKKDRETEPQKVAIRNKTVLPKIGDKVKYLPKNSNEWVEGEVISYAGKRTGGNKYWLNFKIDGESTYSIDWENGVQSWQIIEEGNVCEILLTDTNAKDIRVAKAKKDELSFWKVNGVYKEVKNQGQSTVSTRWVPSEKISPTGETKLKERLVIKGYEEKEHIQADSPTVSKEVLRIFFSVIASKDWSCNSMDIKAAFLQGRDIQRNVYVKPPLEANCDKDTLWKLNKSVYGLKDASREWYFTIKTLLMNQGCKQILTDPSAFSYYENNVLSGVFLMHVDDFLWEGTKHFEEHVINKIRNKFQISQQSSRAFKYIGMELEQDDYGIRINQNLYSESIKPISIKVDRHKDSFVDKEEYDDLRTLIGQLNWLCINTRPDIAYDVLELSCDLKKPKVRNLIKANKVLKKIKLNQCNLYFPKLGNLNNIKIVTYSDASHANLPDGTSSAGGFMVFLQGENGNSCPIYWESKKIKRVVRSTLAAETLASSESIETSYYVRNLLIGILNKTENNKDFHIIAHVDNKSLYENVYSTKKVEEKRLRIDLGMITQHIDQGYLTIKWVDTAHQISDSLTKNGADASIIRKLISHGRLI